MHAMLSIYLPLSYPADKIVNKNHGEYVTGDSRKHLDAPSKLITF